ncbi:MAG: hypothetical protein K2P26_07845 [Oscillospiraceae bacterium]|nr:hypothetical protein [Oscillospiraceae bacterium]
MKNKRRILLGFAALLLAITAALCLWYSRPLTIEDLCPGLDLEKCTGVYAGYSAYENEISELYNRISLTPENGLTPLLELFQGRHFRRSPFWWIPRGTRTHPIREGDFRWDIDLAFENAPVTDISTATGYLLHFNNFYGDLDMEFMGDTRPVSTADQEQWLEDVLAYILEADPNVNSK